MKASDIIAQLTANRRARAAGPDVAPSPLVPAPPALVNQRQPGIAGSAIVGGLRGVSGWLSKVSEPDESGERGDFGYKHIRRTAEGQQGRTTGPFSGEEPQFGRPTATAPSINSSVAPLVRRERSRFGEPETIRTRFGLLPGYKRGGEMPAGVPAVVGEEQPEVVIPKQPSVAIPVSEVLRAVQGQQPAAVERVAPAPEAATPAAPGAPRSILGAVEALKAQRGAAAPSRTPEQLQSLGIPPDAEELPKVAGSVGVDESFTPAPGAQMRPRWAIPQSPPAPPPDALGGALPSVSGVPTPAPETGGTVDVDGPSQTRARVAAPVDFLRRKLSEESARQPADRNGGWKSTVLSALITGSDALAQTGDWRTALGAAGTGAVVGGLVDKSFDENLRHQRYVTRLQQQYEAEVAREGERLKMEGAQADVRLKNEQADYWGQRPEADAAKREDARAKEARSRVFRVLGSLKGQRLDPASPRVQKLQADADDAGIPFDVDAFNESKGNLIRYTKTDPEHPEQTMTVERNLVTGEETVLGQKGFQAPRDAEGFTPSERASMDDRRKLLDRRARNMDLVASVLERDLAGMTAGEKRSLDASLAGLPGELGRLRGELKKWKEGRANLTTDPDAADAEIVRLEDAINDVSSRIEEAKNRVGVSGAAASRPGRFAGRRMPRKNLPTAARELGVSEAEAERIITEQGGTIY